MRPASGCRRRGPSRSAGAGTPSGTAPSGRAGSGGRSRSRPRCSTRVASADGPFPLVLFMHGNHASCFKGQRTSYRWPCRRGWRPLPNHRGYDYAASRLASYGFIVASVSANGVNVLGSRLADTGMRQRGELLEEHLDRWNRWSTVGGEPFGDRFVGRVDMSTIGSMGHSRGGEGVVWHVIVDRERDDPYGIDAVLPLAPVDFTRETVNRVALAVVLPYCDGDVFDLQGVHLYDDARYRVPGDRTPEAHADVARRQPQLLQPRLDSLVRLSRGVRRRALLALPRQADAGAAASGGRRLHRLVLPASPGRGAAARPGLDRRRRAAWSRSLGQPHGLPGARPAAPTSGRGPVPRRRVHRADGARARGRGVRPVPAGLVREHDRDAVRARRPVVRGRAPARRRSWRLRVVEPRGGGAVRSRVGRGRAPVRRRCGSGWP